MQRNGELANNDEERRAAEVRDAPSERGAKGYTQSDSLVRDDSAIDASATPADRTPRATDGTVGADAMDHDSAPSVGDQVGEAAGGISGVVAGAAIGSLGGPIGTVIGGIAGAVGGWWTGRAISEAVSNFSHADDEEFRSDFETRGEPVASTANRSYERVRPAYQIGYLASQNPEYAGRSFDDIEPDLERGWTGNPAADGIDWTEMRDYARTAYLRGAQAESPTTSFGSSSPSQSIGNEDAVEGALNQPPTDAERRDGGGDASEKS